jgi:hypothetical protein
MANKSKSEPRSSVKIIEIRTPTDASKLSGSGVPVGLFCLHPFTAGDSLDRSQKETGHRANKHQMTGIAPKFGEKTVGTRVVRAWMLFWIYGSSLPARLLALRESKDRPWDCLGNL